MDLTPLSLTPLFLLLVANGGPIIAEDLLGTLCTCPLDRGHKAPDGRDWLGASKTWRGLAAGMLLPALVAPLVGVDWLIGAAFGGLAMCGDVLASFTKRRLGLPASGQAPGLDQVPESLLPLAICAGPLNLSPTAVLINVVLFWVVEILLSRVLYWLHIRKKPY